MKIERMKDCEICQICWKMKNAKYYKISEIDAGFMFLCEDCLNELCQKWRKIEIDERIETIKTLNDYLTWREKKKGKVGNG